MALIPSHCHTCGAIFPSRAYSFSGNIKGLNLSNNSEKCPYCSGTAYLAEGIFDIAENAVSIISSPDITKENLHKLGVAVIDAYKDPKKTKDLLALAKTISPEVAGAVEKIATSNKLTLIGLFLLAMIIKSCSVNFNVDVSLDVNELIEEMQNEPPQTTDIETFKV